MCIIASWQYSLLVLQYCTAACIPGTHFKWSNRFQLRGTRYWPYSSSIITGGEPSTYSRISVSRSYTARSKAEFRRNPWSHSWMKCITSNFSKTRHSSVCDVAKRILNHKKHHTSAVRSKFHQNLTQLMNDWQQRQLRYEYFRLIAQPPTKNKQKPTKPNTKTNRTRERARHESIGTH